ncbi:KilA-N domain-containing protein [Halomonas meridiana]|uniref:KilA-N domain-containing protein n=1 Tax=Vreelandella aquamarina TaxID=77097 RepID=UPI00273ACB3A|nr:KilA-N domain-containing protein [Halomonas meridiana]MDP4557924.1 KilA-N domain-containing protein [Halomonas meridiana]
MQQGFEQIGLPMIPHQMEGSLIHQRASDGYINATAMCQTAGKLFGHYYERAATREFLRELAHETGIPEKILIHAIKGGRHQGTWVHPQVAIHLAQWLSPRFSVKVTKWVYEWMSGGATQKEELPSHIRRYMANRSEIPSTHFSILNEITFALIAPMEEDGYTLPDNMVPDISTGRMFSAWLRKEKGIEPRDFPSYKHRYLDGRVVDARLYPNELLADFREHFHNTWLPQRAESYFSEKDPKALEYLPKLIEHKKDR